MATLQTFKLAPGFHRESTQYAEEGKWFDGNRVRFREGKPENMRGYETRAQGDTFDGSARALLAWKPADNISTAIFGTPEKLYVHEGDELYDVTPITEKTTLTNCFGTSSGEVRVCCSDNAHGRVVGDYVLFTSSAAFNAVSLQGNTYQVVSVESANAFTINVTTAANATGSDVGSATFNYYIPTGNSVAAAGLGWAAAPYNAAEPTSVGISKITTTGGNTLVTISCAAAHGGVANDFVYFLPSNTSVTPVTVGGNLVLTKPTDNSIDIGGPQFTIVSVNGTQIIVSVNTAASASGDTTSDINMTALIYPQTGGGAAAKTRGWNQAASASASDLFLDISQWSFDNWGDDVVANRKGGGLFYYDSDASTEPVRATSVTTSPVSTNSIIVSPNDRHLICLGTNRFEATATVSGTFDPMLVRWSDQDNRNEWNPTATTDAGEVVLTDGTRIVGAVRARNAINIWTDNALWLMQFVGGNFVFKFQQVGTNCGLIGQHAAIDYNGTTYWMGYDNFYVYAGAVQVLDCTVRRFIFDDLNTSYYDKVYCGINSEFREIIWLYVSNGNTECNKYVIYNPEEKYWVYGEMIFTTFTDRGVFDNTITTGVTVAGNNIYNNEPPSVFTGSGETLTSFVESGDFDINDGNQVMFMNKIIPDYDLSGGQIKFKIITKKYPESTEQTTKEFDIFDNTEKINIRARGRQAKIRVSCASNNASWRWGSVRLALQGDGER
jgi:hypothetical protein